MTIRALIAVVAASTVLGFAVLPGIARERPSRPSAGSEPSPARPATPVPPPRPAGLTEPAKTGSPPTPRPSPEPLPSPAPLPSPQAETGPNACLRSLTLVAGNRVRLPDPNGKPLQEAGCRVIDPIRIEALAIGSAGAIVEFEPPVTVACELAPVLTRWLEVSVMPLARASFARNLTTLSVGGGHECRRRNRSASGPLSEHSTGQALDIFAFVLDGDGTKAPTGDAVKIVVEKPDGDDQARFLAGVRQSACGAFMTALGPGADAAHANHLHVDIQPRRSAASRFCQ